MMRLRLAAISVLVALGLMVVVPLPVAHAAWNPFGGIECGGRAQNSTVCADRSQTGDTISGVDGIIIRIANIMAAIGGMIAIIIIVLSGLRFVGSGGSSEDIAGARKALIYAIVGLVIIAIARLLVQLIISLL